MAVVKALEEDEIPADLREKIQFFKGPLGVIPSSVRTMAHRPLIAEAFTQLNIAVMTSEGNVTAEFKRLIGFAVSMMSGCRYCQAHMALASERFGSTDERIANILDYAKSEYFNDAEKVALDYVFAALETPNAVSDEHATRLREYWTDTDIVEITAVIALFGYLNRWNDTMGSVLEDLPIQAAEKHLENTEWAVGKHQ